MGNAKGIDKKEIAVWKIPEDVDKQCFRHWLDAIDQQLELVHGFKHASFVMNEIPRSNIEITEDVFTACVAEANDKVLSSLTAMGVTASTQ